MSHVSQCKWLSFNSNTIVTIGNRCNASVSLPSSLLLRSWWRSLHPLPWTGHLIPGVIIISIKIIIIVLKRVSIIIINTNIFLTISIPIKKLITSLINCWGGFPLSQFFTLPNLPLPFPTTFSLSYLTPYDTFLPHRLCQFFCIFSFAPRLDMNLIITLNIVVKTRAPIQFPIKSELSEFSPTETAVLYILKLIIKKISSAPTSLYSLSWSDST